MPGLGTGISFGSRGASLPSRPAYDAASRTASGLAPAGSTVTILLSGTVLGSVSAGAQGRWSYIFATPPTEGQAIVVRAEVASPARIVARPAGQTVPLSISGSPGGGEVGIGSIFAPIISGGTAPYTLSLASGTLPPGRTVNGAAKTVTGTYTTPGSYSYVLRATDAAGKTADLPVSLTITSAGSAPRYGLVTATADGSTGQTYTLNAPWTGLQWHRMALASPFGLTPISGATASTYVATAADEGSRLAVTGTEGGVQKAAKSLHVVYPAPVLLENFESLTGWTTTNGGVMALAKEGAVLGSNRLSLTSTGQSGNTTAVKNDIGSFDTSTLGTIAVLGDLGLDESRQQGSMNIALRKLGVDKIGPSFGTSFETPAPLLIGKLWGAVHVSENADLAAPGGGTIGIRVGAFDNIPYSKEVKFDALLGKAGGRPTVILGFDDNEATLYANAFPILQSYGFPGVFYLAKSLAGGQAGRNTVAQLQEMYAAGWDCGLDSTHNDDISDTFGTLAAWEASFQQNRDFALAQGMTRGNEHICYTHGRIEKFVNQYPSDRLFVSAVTSDGSNVVTIGGTTTAYPPTAVITVGMRAVGHNVPNSPVTTVTAVNGSQVTLSANVPAQTLSMAFIDTAPEFATMKFPKRVKQIGVRTARTTVGGTYLTRFGYGDRGMFTFGQALHFGDAAGFEALLNEAILRGLTCEFYTHGVYANAPSGHTDIELFRAKMAILAQKRDAGLLDVMTPSQVWARDGLATIPANIQPPPTVVPSGVSYVGGSSANAAPVMPAGHKAGDLLLAFAYRDGGNAAPTLPTG